jgi:hypothetical protein
MSLWSNKDSGAITGLVGITGPTFTIPTSGQGTAVGVASTYYNVPQLSVTGTPAASGATFTVTKIGTGTVYPGFTIINAAGCTAANGYSTSSVIKLSGANLGGVVGTNDLTINLTGLPTATLTGTDGSFTQTGTAVAQTTTYTGVVQKASSGTTTGTGAVFSVARTGGTSYAANTTVRCTTPGTGYRVNDTFVILGSSLGGVDGAPGTGNDLTVTITALPTAFSSELKAGSFVYLGPTTAAATATALNSTISGTTLTANGTPTGTFAVGMALSGGATTAGTYITSLGTGTGGAGTYNVNISQNVASTTITGTTTTTASGSSSSISGTVLTVGGTKTGTFCVGMAITGTGVLAGTYITSNTGTVDQYNINQTHSAGAVSSTAITGTTQPATKYKILKVDSNTSATLTSFYEAPTFTGGVITKHTAPTSLSLADARNAVFVSKEEAQLAVNKAKGFTGAGWWLHKEYNDASGKPRYKSECLVSITVPESVSFDAPASSGEDLFASDADRSVSISGQPESKSIVTGNTTSFSVTASVSSGTVTYQWQRALAATPTRFTNINGATSASYTTPTQFVGNTGDLYRVVVSSAPNGAVKVISDAAKLTVTSS